MGWMKIDKSAWSFQPRQWAADKNLRLHEDPETRRSRQLQDLRNEHPWMGRAVEVLELGSWVAHTGSTAAPWGHISGGVSAATAVAAGAWGINKLARGETALDRIEGTGHLALAVDAGMSSLAQFRPDLKWTAAVAAPAGFIAAGCELALGGADLVRGIREKDAPRQWAGIAQLVSGSALAASIALPGATGLAQGFALVSMATRQSIYGLNGLSK
jgi:hypothetical protein